MLAPLKALFGRIPANAGNLEIVGEFPRRLEIWEGACIWPGSGVVRKADGEIEIESIWVRENLEHCGDFQSRWSLFPQRKRGEFFNLSLYWGHNYYHWHCDVLTRLWWTLPRLRAGTKVVLPPGLSPWQRRSLELMGVHSDDCVTYEGRRPWKVERLVWSSPMAMTGDLEADSVRGVRETILGAADPQRKASAGRRLYLTRRGARSREVLNEEELMPVLQRHGFEVVDCGAVGYEEQIGCFSDADVVVGPHGAAFTNLLWMLPGAKVLEIFEPGSVRRCYWSMCQALGHRHFCAVGEAVENPGGEPHLRIRPDQLDAALANVFEAAAGPRA